MSDSFKDIYNCLYDQVKAHAALTYVSQNHFYKGFKDAIPQQKHVLIFEPGSKIPSEDGTGSYSRKVAVYEIEIYCRVVSFGGGVAGNILGSGNDKGVLDFAEDVVTAIDSDETLGYSRSGSSVSAANGSTSFALSGSNRYLSVLMNSIGRSGYTLINCGTTTLTGTQVAANIQTALRALGLYVEDGYEDALGTFDDSTKKFTITSQLKGPASSVVVGAGASNDCSALLGFDSPTEVSGRNIVNVDIGSIDANNEVFPVRYRILPVTIKEEI